MPLGRDSGARASLLPDGRRLHLQHGPIDLIIEADGEQREVAAAYRQAESAFETVLDDLVGELDILRRPVAPAGSGRENHPLRGPVAKRMLAAALPLAATFLTPMAAVAGSVADHILHQLLKGRQLARAYVNNGGDIALYLPPGAQFTVAVCADPRTGGHAATTTISAGDGIAGIATSGWRGRSHSLGIADAVTVLASTAAQADVAATLIANAVNLKNCPAIQRTPAVDLSPDSDLGHRLVTVSVEALERVEINQALDAGLRTARELRRGGLFNGVYLNLQGEIRTLAQTVQGAGASERLRA